MGKVGKNFMGILERCIPQSTQPKKEESFMALLQLIRKRDSLFKKSHLSLALMLKYRCQNKVTSLLRSSNKYFKQLQPCNKNFWKIMKHLFLSSLVVTVMKSLPLLKRQPGLTKYSKRTLIIFKSLPSQLMMLCQ